MTPGSRSESTLASRQQHGGYWGAMYYRHSADDVVYRSGLRYVDPRYARLLQTVCRWRCLNSSRTRLCSGIPAPCWCVVDCGAVLMTRKYVEKLAAVGDY